MNFKIVLSMALFALTNIAVSADCVPQDLYVKVLNRPLMPKLSRIKVTCKERPGYIDMNDTEIKIQDVIITFDTGTSFTVPSFARAMVGRPFPTITPDEVLTMVKDKFGDDVSTNQKSLASEIQFYKNDEEKDLARLKALKDLKNLYTTSLDIKAIFDNFEYCIRPMQKMNNIILEKIEKMLVSAEINPSYEMMDARVAQNLTEQLEKSYASHQKNIESAPTLKKRVDRFDKFVQFDLLEEERTALFDLVGLMVFDSAPENFLYSRLTSLKADKKAISAPEISGLIKESKINDHLSFCQIYHFSKKSYLGICPTKKDKNGDDAIDFAKLDFDQAISMNAFRGLRDDLLKKELKKENLGECVMVRK